MANVESNIIITPDNKLQNKDDAGAKLIDFVQIDGQIVTAQIPDLAVTTPKIANGAVTTPKIADNTITTAKISTDGLSPAVTGCTLLMRAKAKTYNTNANDWADVALEEAYRVNPISGQTWSYYVWGGENIGFRVPETGWYSLSCCLQAANPTGMADTTFVVTFWRGTTLADEIVLTRRPQTNNYRQLLTASDYFFEVTNVDVAYILKLGSLQNGNITIDNNATRRSWVSVKKIGPL